MSTELTPSMRRSVLIAALRDPATWPVGFEWDFGMCRSCAIGLYCATFERRQANSYDYDYVGSALGLTWHHITRVFDSPGYGGYRESLRVTPAMVADRLEQIHCELEATP